MEKNAKYLELFELDWSPPILIPNPGDFNKIAAKNDKMLKLDDIILRSDNFPINFPINTVRCRQLRTTVDPNILEKNINSTYPIIHEGTLRLYADFLKMKRRFGTDAEKRLYHDMDILGLVQRLLQCRAISFWGPGDTYLLRSKEEGLGKWDTIGSSEEKSPLILENVISYDEIKLSAFLYVSGFTQFINNGFRQNRGIPATNRNEIIENGLIIGLIGARLKKKHVMEYQDIIVTKEQNSYRNGYGPLDLELTEDSNILKKHKWHQLWADYYEEPNNLYETVRKKVIQCEKQKEMVQYAPARAKDAYFDNMYYKKRLIVVIDTLLIEANHRAKIAGKMAYIHMVGIGLGVWKNAGHQEGTFLDVFAQRLTYLKESIRNISDVHFAYFKLSEWNEIKNDKKFLDKDHPNGGVVVHISKREPASKLQGVDDENKLLIVSYAWDGNAQPGNEFWMGKLKSSGDSSTASSSQVSELHNSLINCENVNSDNLHVASRAHGVEHVSRYLQRVRAEHS